MDDPTGRQIVKLLGGKDYSTLSLAIITEYIKNLSAQQKEITLMEIDFEQHSSLAIALIKENKLSNHALTMSKLLMELNLEQIVHFSQFKDLCQMAVECSEFMLENGTGIKLTKALKVQLILSLKNILIREPGSC